MRTLAVLVSMAIGVLAYGQGQSATPEKHQQSKAQHGPYERPSSARPYEGKDYYFISRQTTSTLMTRTGGLGSSNAAKRSWKPWQRTRSSGTAR